MDYDDFKKLCKNRRSIRYFDEKPVSEEDVLQLLELARLSPSVENLQPWHFHVIFDKKMRSKLMDASCYGNFVEGAGVFIVVTANRSLENIAKEPVWNPKELEYSCVSAIENILLGATALNLGSSWVSLHHGSAHEILHLPRHEVVIGGVMLGHYRKGEDQASNGRQRKPLDDIYTFHRS
jgi:nitroreductase